MDTQLVDADVVVEIGDAGDGYYACTVPTASFDGPAAPGDRVSRPSNSERAAATRASAGVADAAIEQQILRDLAGGIAGELNNLLTVMSGRASLLLETQGLPPGANTGLSDIMHASHRAAELVRRLLCAAGSARLYAEPVPIGGWLRGIHAELDSLLGPGIELQLGSHGEPGVAWVDRAGLRTTLRELARNARDAMPDGGRFTISVSRVFHAPTRRRGAPAAEYVLLTVSDTGHGIPDDIRDRVFRPLFTTRRSEGKVGLGLAAVEQFLHASGGEISVYSVPGEGTSFCLLLPAEPSGG
jgi:two-component system cell cycle sensor histidine kinase/response regulator CckA